MVSLEPCGKADPPPPRLGQMAEGAAFNPVLLLTPFDGAHSRGRIGPRRVLARLVRRC
jgi:hypothetical protein